MSLVTKKKKDLSKSKPVKAKTGLGLWNRKKLRSGFEEQIRDDLNRRGIDYGYETLKLKYSDGRCKHCGEPTRIRTYTPDFILNFRLPLVVEGKGFWSSPDRTKILNVIKDNPSVDLRLLFQRNQFIGKSSKTRYSDWCEKHNIRYAIGNSIPEEWIKEKKGETKAMP